MPPYLPFAFIIFWFLWCSAPWVSPYRFTAVHFFLAESFKARFIEWAWRLPCVVGLGYALDLTYGNRPHESYGATDFYAVLLSISVMMTIPAIIYYLYRRGRITL